MSTHELPNSNNEKSYYVNEHREQVTVLGTSDQDPNVKPHVPWQAWAIVLLCAIGSFQNVFLGIAPAANSYTIAGALGGSDKRIWIVQAQGVPSIASGPILSIIADVYGRRNVILFCWALYCVSFIVSMTATGINAVIAGQTMAGVAAGVSGLMFAVPSEVLPSIYRAHVQTFVNWISGFASILALIAMGAAVNADHDNGWRWVFRTNLIFSGILLLGFAFLYKPPPRTVAKGTLAQKLKGLDWIGYFLLIAGLVPLLMGFAWASDANYGWHDAHSYGPVAVGLVCFIACIVYEWKGTSTGFLHHRLFENGRNFPLALVLIAVEGSLFYLITNIYASEANGLWDMPGTISANARLLPFFMVITVVSPFISIYVTKRKDLKWPLCVGFTLFSACIIGLALSKTNATMATVFCGVGGLGFSAPLILVMTLVQLSTPPLFIGVASALVISARTLGGVVGLSIAEAIYASQTTDQIPAAIIAAVAPLGFNLQYLGNLIGFLFSGQGLQAIPNINGQIIGAASAALKTTQAEGYKVVWFAFLPGTAVAAVICVFFKNPSERMNYVVDAPLEVSHRAGEHELETGSPQRPGSVAEIETK